MSWGSPPYLQEIYERRYWEHEAPLLGEMMGFSEGAHSEFAQEIYHYNRKYTHHPIGLIHDMKVDPAFRHLTLERLIEAVYAEKHHRQSACCGVEAIQIDPAATRYSVALGVGLCCRTCDNLIFKGTGLSTERWPPEERWEFIDKTLRNLVRDQRHLYHAVERYNRVPEYVLPMFCENCFAVAQKVPDFTSWDYAKPHALRQLLAIFEKQSSTTFGVNREECHVMKQEDLRAARLIEAKRRWIEDETPRREVKHLADLYESNWTPPEPEVDLEDQARALEDKP
jgi:hypothetical protein